MANKNNLTHEQRHELFQAQKMIRKVQLSVSGYKHEFYQECAEVITSIDNLIDPSPNSAEAARRQLLTVK